MPSNLRNSLKALQLVLKYLVLNEKMNEGLWGVEKLSIRWSGLDGEPEEWSITLDNE